MDQQLLEQKKWDDMLYVITFKKSIKKKIIKNNSIHFKNISV